MLKRRKVSKKRSKRDFHKKGKRVHPKNRAGPVSRGGIRL